MRTTLFSEDFQYLKYVILNLQSPVILNLFQDNEQPWRVILKQVQDDEGGAFRMTQGCVQDDEGVRSG